MIVYLTSYFKEKPNHYLNYRHGYTFFMAEGIDSCVLLTLDCPSSCGHATLPLCMSTAVRNKS